MGAEPHGKSTIAGSKEEVIQAADGYEIHATCYTPENPNGQVLLVCPAMAVWQRYYIKFARFMAEEGYVTYTFDNRGIGNSAPPSLRGLHVRLHEWATLDTVAVIRHIREKHPDAPLVGISHSLGGQVLGLYAESAEFKRHIFVASSFVRYEYWPTWFQPMLFWIWYVALPGLSNLFGYFPGKKVGMFGNLPKGVAKDWAQWCRNGNYCLNLEQAKYYDTLTIPIRGYSFTDDKTAPSVSIAAMLEKYPNAQTEHLIVSPEEAGVDEIGHFGYFREKVRDTLWKQASEWLRG